MPIDKHGNLWAKDVMEEDMMEELDKEGVLAGVFYFIITKNGRIHTFYAISTLLLLKRRGQ